MNDPADRRDFFYSQAEKAASLYDQDPALIIRLIRSVLAYLICSI